MRSMVVILLPILLIISLLNIDISLGLPTSANDESTYSYIKEAGRDQNIEMINIHFKNAIGNKDQSFATADSIWQLSDHDPSKVIYNIKEEVIIDSNSPLWLKDGYKIAITHISGDKVRIDLSKDGIVIDQDIVVVPNNMGQASFIYTKDLEGGKKAELIKIHFKNAFKGAEHDIATIDSIWQVSEYDPSVVLMEQDNEMTITSGSPLRLEEGYELAIKSIDVDGNKIYLELRKGGTDIHRELIEPPSQTDATFVFSKNIGQNKKAEIFKIKFKNAFKGAEQDIATIDSIWQASDRNPYRIINDSAKDIILTSMTPLILGEGYEMNIKSIDVDGNKVYVELSKNGESVHSTVIVTPINRVIDTYTYFRSEQSDGGQISVHFINSFKGAEQDLATVDSIWQMSESNPSVVLTKEIGNRTFKSATSLDLSEGYELALKSIDVDGNKVYVELSL